MLSVEMANSNCTRRAISISEIEPGSLIVNSARLLVSDESNRYYIWLSNFSLERVDINSSVFKDQIYPRNKLILVPQIEIPLDAPARDSVFKERAVYAHQAGDTFYVPSTNSMYVVVKGNCSAINLFSGRVESLFDLNSCNKIPIDLTMKVKND